MQQRIKNNHNKEKMMMKSRVAHNLQGQPNMKVAIDD